MLLAGDIGGTKTLLALYAPDPAPGGSAPDRSITGHSGGDGSAADRSAGEPSAPARSASDPPTPDHSTPHSSATDDPIPDDAATDRAAANHPIAEAEFHSADYPSLEAMARVFLARAPRLVTDACFGAAGPVLDGRVHFTNLPWVLDTEALRQSLGLRRVTLLNDLQAIAYAVPHLEPSQLHNINPGTRQKHAPIAVVAPGTGLGEAFLIWTGRRYVACPSEGGHAGFAPADEQQVALWRYLAARFGHVSVERVCSGPGIANIYDFLRDADPDQETPGFADMLAEAADRTPLIAEAALETPTVNKLAVAALDLFVSIFAGEAGNMALKVLATGGVTLAGGIPAHILTKLTDGQFLRGFTDKGRFADLLGRVPIDVVTTRAALLGAALHGLDQMRSDHMRQDHAHSG